MSVVIFGWTAIAQTQGFSVLLLPLTEQIHVTARDISLLFLVGALGGAFLMPLVGRMLDKRGARRILIIATAIYALAFCVLALVPVKAIAIAALLAIRLIGSIVLWLGASVLVAWWFARRRGFALGILVGVGSAVLSLLAFGLSRIISQVGVATSFLILAGLACVLLMPMLVWGVVDRPSELGQHPDGDEPQDQGALGDDVEDDLYGVPASVAYRTTYAWVLTAGGGLIALVTTGYLFHEAVIFVEQGATAEDAALSLLPQMAGNAVAVLLVSSLVDRFRMRWIIVVSMAQVLLTIWWGFNLGFFGPIWLFGISFGVSTGAFFGYALAALPRYFGTRHVGEIRGTFGAVTMATASFGPIAFEVLHEEHQALLLVVTGILAAGLSVLSIVMRWPEPMHGPSEAIVREGDRPTSLEFQRGPAGTGS